MEQKKKIWVWLDLEMSGLCVNTDVILEIALVLTDQALQPVAPSFSCIIHQPKEVLEGMNSWCKENHAKSGLTHAVIQSTVTISQAEQDLCHILDQQDPQAIFILCGNSIWQDRLFINKYLSSFAAKLHYRMIDVSSVKELINAWYPNDQRTKFNKKKNHRAVDDIYESIKELRHYKEYFFH